MVTFSQKNSVITFNYFRAFEKIKIAKDKLPKNGGPIFEYESAQYTFINTCPLDYFLLVVFILFETNQTFQNMMKTINKDIYSCLNEVCQNWN